MFFYTHSTKVCMGEQVVQKMTLAHHGVIDLSSKCSGVMFNSNGKIMHCYGDVIEGLYGKWDVIKWASYHPPSTLAPPLLIPT